MTIHATLTAALQDIAARSLYESATVTPNDDGTFTVEDDFATAWAGDGIQWTPQDGAEWPARALDHSRVHEAYEFYDDARHIAYNLPVAVATLEEGKPVTFAYDIVSDVSMERDEDGNTLDDDGNLSDDLVGWALLAFSVGE